MSRFDEIYAKHAATVFRYALKCAGRRDVAEDITSEVFLTLHRTIDSIDVNQLPSWLFTVAKNRAVDHWRRAHVEQKALDALEPAEVTWEPSVEVWLREATGLKPFTAPA